MRHLIILPGNSPANLAWGKLMLTHYAEYFDTLYLQEYDHWQTGESQMNFSLEEEKLRAHLGTLPKDVTIFVLAKSAGSILSFKAVQAGIFYPAYCVFFGIPFEWAITDVFLGNWSAIEEFTVPAIAFHNSEDPTAPFAYTKAVVDLRLPRLSLITTTGNDHRYEDFATYDQYLLPIFQR